MTSGPIFVSPGRLEFRNGGGCLAIFGAPFLASGLFMLLATMGAVTMHTDGQPSTRATLVGLSALFTLVGGLLVFGRSVTAVDVGQYVVTKQWRAPARSHLDLPARRYTAVTLTFVRGDSDTADCYPVGLKGDAIAPPQPHRNRRAHRCWPVTSPKPVMRSTSRSRWPR